MTREMEERIVAMYFDNENFEKNAKTTIDTLGQLREGLNLKESAKGFEVFDKIGKTLNFEKAQKGLTKIKTTLNGMGGIFKKVFNLGPIDDAAAAVENFKHRYLDRVLGFDLARVVANSLESAFRGLTIQPVTAGWTQYQNKMDSVKTIMSSTGESIETVEKHLQSLTTYANKTIYSLSDMTSNLGKFTNNGMKLEDSVLAMQGIANAAADAGQGAQQASMAMYNFSQAMGVGKMTTIDWKSIENANMATQRLKNTFIEMAAAQGELHKEFSETDKKYHYYITKNSKGQTEKDRKNWTEVTAKNFRETLSKDWLTAEAMMHALMVYSGEALDPDTVKSWGITDPELIKSFEEIGQNALTAATQVRTFGKMMDALKEAAQSGWADTFELIFGNMEQGTTLWTDISEVIDGILSKSAEARNNMLKIWAGSSENTKEEEEELKSKTESLKSLEEYLARIEEEGDIDKTTSKIDEMRASIQKYKDEIAELRKGQNKGNKESTQAQIDRRLKKIEELEASVDELEKRNKKNTAAKENQDKMDDLQAQIDAYQSEIQALRNADAIDSETDADASKKRQQQITDKEKAMARLQEQLNKLREKTGVDEIEKTKKEIEALKKEIEELNGVIDEKNSKPKSEFVDEQGRSGRDIIFDRETGALFRLIDLAQEFGKTFSDAFHSAFGFMDAEKLFNMTRDFGKAVERVVEWFGKANEEGSRLNKIQKGLQGVFSILKTVVNFVKMGFNLVKRLVAPVADFAINAFEKVFGFFDGLGNLKPVEVFQKLGEGLQKTWEKVKKFFSPKDIVDKNGKVIGQGELPVIKWLKTTWEGLKSTVRSWANDVGLGDVYNNVAKWWDEFKSSINTAFEGIQTWWNGTGIPEFFANMWNGVTGAFQPKANVVSGYRNGRLESWYEEAPIVSWLTGIWDSVKSAWNSIAKWEGWSTIATFASNTWGWISSQFKSSGNVVSGYRNGRLESWYEEAPVVSWLTGIWDGVKSAWNSIVGWEGWTTIATFASNTWGWITSQFKSSGNVVSGYRNGRLESWYEEAPVVSWLSGIWEGVKNVWNEIVSWSGWSTIATFASNTWGWISSQFKSSGNVVSGYRNGRLESWYEEAPIVSWLTGIWDGVKSVWDSIAKWEGWSAIATFASNTWGWISSQFKSSGNVVSGYRNGRLESWYEDAPIVSWLSGIWEGVKSVWDEIVGWKGWASIGTFLSNTWSWITGWFNGSSDSIGGASEEAAKTAEKVVEESNAANVSPEQTEESLDFFQRIMGAIGDFVSKVSEAMKGVVIPSEVSTFFEHLWEFASGVLKIVGDVLGSFGKLFNGKAGTEEWNYKDGWNIFFSIIAGIGTLVVSLMSAHWTSKLSAVNNIGTQFLMFGGGMLLIASAISLLTTIDQNKMMDGAKVLGVLAVAIGTVLFSISSINQSVNSVQTTGVERFFTNLINKAASLGMIYVIVSALPGIIKSLSEAKAAGADNIGEDVLKIAEGIGILFSAVSITMGVLSKLTPGGIDPIAATKTALSVAAIAAVMVGVFQVIGGIPRLIGEGIEGDQKAGVDAAVQLIRDGGRVMSALGIAIGEFFGSLIGAFGGGVSEGAMVTAANGVARASEVLSSVTAEQLDKFSIMLGFVVELQKSFGNSNLLDVLDRLTTGGKLGTLGEQLPKLGTGMVGFIEQIRDFSSEDMDKMRESMRFLSYFGNAVALVANATTGKQDFFGRVGINRIVFQEYLEAAEQLSEAVKEGLRDENGEMTALEFNAMPIIESICKALLNGKDNIARAVKDMVNEGLKAVDDGDYTSRSRLKVPEEVIDKYNEVIGLYKTETGEAFDINTMLNDLMGDQGTFNSLMDELDRKTEDIGKKWNGFTDIFNNTDFMKFNTIDPETGEESKLDILSYFQNELDKLEETINSTDPITITITPVFDMTNMTPEKLQAALNNRFVNDPLLARISADSPTAKLDSGNLRTELGIDEIKSKLGNLYDAVVLAGNTNIIALNGLKSNVDGVSNAIAGMRLVLDTGVLVGQITPMVDLALGQRSRIFDRTGVVFTKS